MSASFGVSSGAFKESGTIWQADASFKDHTGSATMTATETGEVTSNT